MRYNANDYNIKSPNSRDIDDIKEESDDQSMFDQSPVIKIGRKSHTRGNSRIFGDLSKAQILPDSNIINKRVIFYPNDTQESIENNRKSGVGHRRRLTNQQHGNTTLDGTSRTKDVRPLTAKTHYKVFLHNNI